MLTTLLSKRLFFFPNRQLMAEVLFDHNLKTRKGLFEVFKDPLFTPTYNQPLAAQRQTAYDRLKKVCESGLFSVKDFWTNPRNIFAVSVLCQNSTRMSASLAQSQSQSHLQTTVE